MHTTLEITQNNETNTLGIDHSDSVEIEMDPLRIFIEGEFSEVQLVYQTLLSQLSKYKAINKKASMEPVLYPMHEDLAWAFLFPRATVTIVIAQPESSLS